LLNIKDLNVHYGGIHALRGVSLEVPEGKIITLTGMLSFKVVQEGIAMTPEGRKVFVNLSVYENLMMGAFNRTNHDEIKKDLDSVFKIFPRLKEREKQQAATLSGGEQQMLAVGRALMSRPKLLMLDEPSLGLAPLLIKEVFRVIKTIHKEGTTILLIEQNAMAALQIAHYGYVMETGKIVLEGTGEELLNDERVKKAYLGEAI
jgi:branched-chain amino acid transport system ATP-binding protein